MKKTNQYLGLTPVQYENDCISQYMRWCDIVAKNNTISLQSLLANRMISNYYNCQFLELEHSFCVIAQKLYGLVDYEIMLRNYEMIMVDLYTNYPSALIEAAKKLKIENPPINNQN